MAEMTCRIAILDHGALHAMCWTGGCRHGWLSASLGKTRHARGRGYVAVRFVGCFYCFGDTVR